MPRKKKEVLSPEAAAPIATEPLPEGVAKKSNAGRKKAKPIAPDPERLDAILGKSDYRTNPVGYCKDVLGIDLTPMQKKIYELALKPPYRVLCGCGVGVGKSWWAATFINWFFDSFVPSVSISTAPTTRDIRDVVWSHVRHQRTKAGLPGAVGNVTCELRGKEGDKHYAKGFAAEKQESFRGRHEKYMGFIFDEATAIDSNFWDSANTMFQQREGHIWVCFFNPIDAGTQAYREWMREKRNASDPIPFWHKIQMGCMDHPNVIAGLEGKKEPFEGAVSLHQMNDLVEKYCDLIDDDSHEAMDIIWPPPQYATPDNPARWYRPGAYFESNVLGRWPSSDVFGVWSRYAWQCCLQPIPWRPGISIWPEIGCDLAGHGDDYTVIHARWGPISLHHERHNGWTPKKTADRLKMLSAEMASKVNDLRPPDAPMIEPEQILTKYDGDGMGYNMVDWKGDFNFQPVCGSGSPMRHQQYHNKRAEIWFQVCAMAKERRLSVAGIRKEFQILLEEQLLAPRWQQAVMTGKIVLEDKEETKKRLGCSPDDAEAMILAYCSTGNIATLAWDIAAQDQGMIEEPVRMPWRAPSTVQEVNGIPGSRAFAMEHLQEEEDQEQRRYWSFGYR